MPKLRSPLLACLLTACGAPVPDDDGTEGPGPGCVAPDGEFDLDSWGGDGRVDWGGTGRFRLEERCGISWFVDPDGHPFWSAGVNSTTHNGLQDAESGTFPYGETTAAIYGTAEAWGEATAARLLDWGFNTAGSWSEAEVLAPFIAVAPNLRLGCGDWLSGEVADLWDPSWVTSVQEKASAGVRVGDAAVLGYFLDNECHWGPDWRDTRTLLQSYLDMPPESAGKAEAVAVLVQVVGGVEAVGLLLGLDLADEAAVRAHPGPWDRLDRGESAVGDAATAEFLRVGAGRYYEVAASAVRAAEPGGLILGNREVSIMTPLPVFEASAPWVDVVSVNSYEYVPGLEELALGLSGGMDRSDGFLSLWRATGRPVLVSEFGWRADDAGSPNTWPPVYPVLADQQARADALSGVTAERTAAPWIVGQHWYMWTDDPPAGRFDGEDNNWGLVGLDDTPYTPVIEAARTQRSGAAARLLVELSAPAP